MAAFGELVRRHQSQLRGWLRQLCRDGALADDLAQDALLHAFDKLGGFSGKGRFQSWLFRIGYTTFLQWQRRSQRGRAILDRLANEPARFSGGDAGEIRADLERLLAVLGEKERNIMVLCYGYGFSHAEISAVVGMPVGTVKSHIHRSKLRLRQEFDLARTGT